MRQQGRLKLFLFVRYSLFALVPALILGALALTQIHRQTVISQETQNLTLARSVSGRMREALSSPEALLGQVPLLMSALSPDRDSQLTTQLNRMVTGSPLLESVMVLDEHGLVLVAGLQPDLEHHRPDLLRLDFVNQPFYQQTRSLRQKTWSGIFMSVASARKSLALCQPLGDKVLLATINIAQLEQVVAALVQGEERSIAVIDSRGALILHSSPELAAEHLNLSHLLPVEEGLSGFAGSYSYRWDNRDYLGSVTTIRDTGWLVLVSQPARSALAVLADIRAPLLAISGIMTLVLVLLALDNATRLSRPFDALSRVAGQMAAGKYGSRLPEQTFREAEDLAASFRLMAVAVQEREQSLEAALIEAQTARDNLDWMLKSVREGLIVCDCHYRLQLLNPAAEDLLGLSPTAVHQQPIAQVIPFPALRDRLIQPLDSYRTAQTSDLDILLPDSEPRTLQVQTSLITGRDGTVRGTITSLRDVTRERESDRLKQEFISIAAHELQTPLTAILGFAELLLEQTGLGPFTPEQKRDFLEEIYQKSNYVSLLVDDLLDISRLERGRPITINPEPTDLAELIEAVVDPHQRATQRHHVRIALPADIQLRVDRHRLTQVLDNLLSNAIKYSPAGGEITIRGALEDGRYHLQVSDEGVGIPPDELDNIFERFYRVDTSTTAVPGLGIGLSVARGIVQAHGGKIWAQSTPGRGTTMHLVLPLNPPRSVHGRPPQNNTSQRNHGQFP